jgi:hypothetical protein
VNRQGEHARLLRLPQQARVFSAAAAARVQCSATIGRFFQQKSRYSVRNAAQGWPVTSILKSSAASFTLQPHLVVVQSSASAPRAAHLVAAFSSQTSIAPLRIIIW